MAKYLVLHPTWLRTRDCAVEQTHPVGAIIEYDGAPGSSLAALDGAASERKRRVVAEYEAPARKLFERDELRYRASLPSWAKELLETAELDPRTVPSQPVEA